MARVISYGTHREGYFDLFMASCRRFGIEPLVLGWGTPWVGFGKKTTDIRDHIRSLAEDEMVVAVDPFDVVFLAGLDEIEAKFRAGTAPFLCGALNLGPAMRRVYDAEFNRTGKPTPRTPSGYDHLNAGTWISTAGYACRLIDRLVGELGMKPTDMEQEAMTRLYIEEPSAIGIDWKGEVFHNLLFKDFVTRRADLKDLRFDGGRVTNTATGARPCVLHASGNTTMSAIALALGYDRALGVPAAGNRAFLKKAVYHVRELLTPGRVLVLLGVALAVGLLLAVLGR